MKAATFNNIMIKGKINPILLASVLLCTIISTLPDVLISWDIPQQIQQDNYHQYNQHPYKYQQMEWSGISTNANTNTMPGVMIRPVVLPLVLAPMEAAATHRAVINGQLSPQITPTVPSTTFDHPGYTMLHGW